MIHNWSRNVQLHLRLRELSLRHTLAHCGRRGNVTRDRLHEVVDVIRTAPLRPFVSVYILSRTKR